MLTQTQRLKRLLSRKCGTTSMEIIHVLGTVSPHRRLFELKRAGWTITKLPINGKRHRYFGTAPKFSGAA